MNYTQTPWTYRRATKPVDGEYDCAILDQSNHIIAETWGRAGQDFRPNSAANAAHIVRCVNNHDVLVNVLKELLDVIDKFGVWEDGCFYYNRTAASELVTPIKQARTALTQQEADK